MLRCNGDANVTECVVSTSIRYTHFHWLIYNLKRSRQEVTRTCMEQGCVGSFHERQKQAIREMKGLILISLYVAMPQLKNPCPRGLEIYNFGRPFLGHHYFSLCLSEACTRVEKKFLKEIMHFLHFISNKAMPQHKTPCKQLG